MVVGVSDMAITDIPFCQNNRDFLILNMPCTAFTSAWAQRPEARCHGLRRDAAATPQGSRISEFAMNPNFGTRAGLATFSFCLTRRHEGTKGFGNFQSWYSHLIFVVSCLRVRFFLKLRESAAALSATNPPRLQRGGHIIL